MVVQGTLLQISCITSICKSGRRDIGFIEINSIQINRLLPHNPSPPRPLFAVCIPLLENPGPPRNECMCFVKLILNCGAWNIALLNDIMGHYVFDISESIHKNQNISMRQLKRHIKKIVLSECARQSNVFTDKM